MIQKQFGPGPEQMKEVESIAAASATRMAVGATALGMYKRVLVNDWRLAKYTWSECVRVIAHELTHSANKELADGKPAAPDQWLSEGFSEWVGYKVVANFGRRTLRLVAGMLWIRLSMQNPIKPFLAWASLPETLIGSPGHETLGLPSTYGQRIYCG
jgi:hypothetical protein